MEKNMEVAARIRPPLHSSHMAEDVCLYADPYTKEIVLANQMSFYVDYALPLEINQSQLFDGIAAPRIEHLLRGRDVSFIAYGHVNSGKTYTLLGPGLHCALSETTYGVLPRAARLLFNKLLAFRQQFGLQFKVSVSFIEICNEEAKDLLLAADNDMSSCTTNTSPRNIGFRTNDKGLTVLHGAEEIQCHNISELFNCLRLGMNNRKTVRTNLNSISSLSHCIVIIKVEQKWFSNQGKLETISSQAMFVDLAGSEQMFLMSPMDSTSQVHQTTTVGNMGLGVISAIIASFSGQWLPSSPFTQSLLFPLLKDSFIGSMKTLLICCLSPSSSDYSETLNSLRLIEHIHTLNKYSFVKDTPAITLNSNSNSYQIIDDSAQDMNNVNVNSSNRDTGGGLEFAATQWLKLVSNAEGLFNKLVDSNMPEDAREEIEEWLCLKQECEECFSVETRTIVNNNNNQNHCGGGRSLEIIEEVTETDTKSKSGKSSVTSESDDYSDDSNSDDSEDDDDEVNELNSNNNNKENVYNVHTHELMRQNNSQCDNFTDRLEELMRKFRARTDEVVDTVLNVSTPERDALEKERKEEAKSVVLPKANRCIAGRRKSILPGCEPILLSDVSTINHNNSSDPLNMNGPVAENGNNSNQVTIGSQSRLSENNISNNKVNNVISSQVLGAGPCLLGLVDTENSECDDTSIRGPTDSTEPDKEFNLLSANSTVKQNQLGLANLDLEAAAKRIDELQSMIKIKEQFIQEMIRNSGARISAKEKFQRKHTRLEEEYCKARTQLAKAEKAWHTEEGNAQLESEVQKYKTMTNQYEKRLQDIETIKQIAGDSAKKVLELENSLHSSKRKMQKLKKQLKKEEEHKYCLEKELIEDQKRIKILEDKYKTQSEKLKKLDTDNNNENNTNIKQTGQDLTKLSSQQLYEQLQEKQILLEKRESFLKERLAQEKNMSKSLLHVSARISHLEHVLKEKSSDLEQEGDIDSKESLRHEIRNLRKTRDCLVEQRRNLDAKFNKDKVLTTVEERKFLECDEAIEAIDSTIEYKNEMICGRKGLIGIIENGDHEPGEQMLLLRLMKLSTMEMRILLYKYFRKVVDLRESGRKMETQIGELDRQAETQAWKIQALSNALQQAHLESERRLIAVQKEHQEKLHLIFRHFADETSGHSSGADDTEKCRRQNKALKQRVLELEAMLYKARSSSQHSRTDDGVRMDGAVAASTSSDVKGRELQPTAPLDSIPQENESQPQSQPAGSQLNIPRHNLRQLGVALAQHTTKVTRQKNKLIIQQQKTNKTQSK